MRIGTRSVFLAVTLIGTTLGSGPVAAQWSPRNSADAVFVGHSLINQDMPHMVAEMAVSRGLRMSKMVQEIPGMPLKGNWEQCRGQGPERSACEAIERGSPNGPYDVLVATDANNPIEANRIFNETHVYLEHFMELMFSRNPSARTFLYTSWEELGSPHHNGIDWVDAIPSELAQYELIARGAEQISAARGRNGKVEVIPANLALRELIIRIERGEISGLSNRRDIFNDSVHMNATGNYFIAAVVFSCIFNRSPEGAASTIPGMFGGTLVSVPSALAVQLQRIAWQVVSDYRSGQPQAVRPNPPAALTSR